VSNINMTVKQRHKLTHQDTSNNSLEEPSACRESSNLEMEAACIPTTTSPQPRQMHNIKTKGQETWNYSVTLQSVSARNNM